MANLFYRYFFHNSLKHLNQFAIWVIFLLTILFSVLLIQEEYKVFEATLHKEENIYLMQQHDEIVKTARRIETLADYEIDSKHNDIERILANMAEVFTEKGHGFVSAYAPDKRVLYEEGEILPAQTEKLDLAENNVISGWVNVEGKMQKAQLYAKTLHEGYRIVVGIYTQPSDAFLKKRTGEMKSRLIKMILGIATLAFILFGFILGINKVVNTLLEKDVGSFLDFFSRAAHSDRVMNPHTTYFKEFKKMVVYANNMVNTISKQKKSLQALNLSLEDKVKQKTEALQVKNAALEEEKAFSQDLLAAQKQFVRYAIHETNTPLSVIVANIELYTMKNGKDRYLSKIEAAVKNIFSIYDDLTYLVKKDQVEYPRQRMDFGAYLQSRIDFFDEVAQQAGLVLAFEGDRTGAFIEFNETKLQRIVDNNLTNAIKYTQPSNVITVALHREEGRCVFSVASRSTVIQDTRKIFEAYYRERKKTDGFGLGLNLVKAICDEEGVQIAIESSASRTRFSYSFPAGRRS